MRCKQFLDIFWSKLFSLPQSLRQNCYHLILLWKWQGGNGVGDVSEFIPFLNFLKYWWCASEVTEALQRWMNVPGWRNHQCSSCVSLGLGREAGGLVLWVFSYASSPLIWIHVSKLRFWLHLNDSPFSGYDLSDPHLYWRRSSRKKEKKKRRKKKRQI